MFKTKLTLISLVIAVCTVSSMLNGISASFAGVYASGLLYPGYNANVQANINDLKASKFTAVLLWCIHVRANGDLAYNDLLIVSNGTYVGNSTWPSYIASLKTGNTSITQLFLSVGSAGVQDFTNIQALIKSNGTSATSILYKNFAVLKKLLPSIDAIDLDDEDNYDTNTIVNFSLMLGQIGFKVSFCPYTQELFWVNCLQKVNAKSAGLVIQFNLQCYAGGDGNNPGQWQNVLSAYGLRTPVYAGLWEMEDTASQMQSQFSTYKREGIKGGFVWLYDEIEQMNLNSASYAAALRTGLGI